MNKLRATSVMLTAEKELKEELFREKVDKYKEKLKNKKPFLHRLFPFKIVRR